MSKYTTFKSAFIKQCMIETGDKNYIDNLLFIEKCILAGPGSFGGSLKFHKLKLEYLAEYHRIREELEPEYLDREIEKHAQEEKERYAILIALKRKEEREQRDFQEALELMDQ